MIRPLVMIRYHWYSLWNWRSVYLGRIIEPSAYFLFLGVGISGVASAGMPDRRLQYIQFVLLGLVCLLAFRAATNALSDVANDRKWGVYALYRMQGGAALGYLASIVAIGCSVFLAQLTVLVLLAATSAALWCAAGAGLAVLALAGANQLSTER